jgi:hypothetical protein
MTSPETIDRIAELEAKITAALEEGQAVYGGQWDSEAVPALAELVEIARQQNIADCGNGNCHKCGRCYRDYVAWKTAGEDAGSSYLSEDET